MTEETRQDGGRDERPVIESASATTDPANAGSGSFAYVVTAVVAVALVLLVSGFSGCAASVSRLAADDWAFGYGTGPYQWDDDSWDDGDDWLDDVDDWLEQPQSRHSGARGGRCYEPAGLTL